MHIQEFIGNYKNHPVLFVGTGISLRYLNNSYTWDGLLRFISRKLKGNDEYYLDIKSQCHYEGSYHYEKVAKILEEEFNKSLLTDRNGQFKLVNDKFYEYMAKDVSVSRLKIYISMLLSSLDLRDELKTEISELKKIRKNVGSIITTNYDCLIENIFEFQPLIGNDILLSNPYGSVYKIHGCISSPTKVIITSDDYERFDGKYELIRAQLLSIFIHNPIIFLGYSIGDDNIKNLLKTIFTYVEPNSEAANKIRANFLLVEHDAGSQSVEICEHDIDLEGFSTIRINKIKTDNFTAIYEAISNLVLPVSAMDIRKVQNIVKEIYAGGSIKVSITEDLDALDNGDKILAIGSSKTIVYSYQSSAEMMANYFSILDESNAQLLLLINKYKFQKEQYFPIFGFSSICPEIIKADELKAQQKAKLERSLEAISGRCRTTHNQVKDIISDDQISDNSKDSAILWGVMNDLIELGDVESYLRSYVHEPIVHTNYRKLICAYDLKRYG